MTGLIIAACLGAMAGAATPPKTIMTIFIDDLGFYDTAVGPLCSLVNMMSLWLCRTLTVHSLMP